MLSYFCFYLDNESWQCPSCQSVIESNPIYICHCRKVIEPLKNTDNVNNVDNISNTDNVVCHSCRDESGSVKNVDTPPILLLSTA